MSITLKQKNSGRVWNGTKVSSPQKNVGEKTGSGMTLTQRPQKAVQTSGAQAPASTSRDWSFFEQGRGSSPARSEAGAASPKLGSIRIPSINKTLSGNINPETLDRYISPRDATLYDLTIGSIMRGYDNSQYGIELYKQMSGQENDADEYAKKMASEKYRFEADGLIGKAVSGASELLGQQLRQWTDPTAIAAGGTAAGAAAIAGQAGPQVLIPEEVFTVPGAFIGGLQVGSGLSNYQIEAGLAYKEMLDNGISEDTASKVATAVGGANAALELVQMDELVKSFQVLNKSGASNGVLDAVLGELKRRGMDVAKETAQEVAQEGVTITGSQVASQIDRGEWQYGAKDVVERLGDTALSSALSFGVLNVPGGVYNVAYGNRTSSPQQAQQATVAEQEPTPVETEISAPSQEQQSSAREAAILRILEENGVTGTPANRQAQGVAALIDGGELSSHRADEIRKSRAAQAAYTQITGETIDTTGRPAEVRARIKQMALDKAAERNAQNVVETIPTQAAVETATQEATEAPVTPVTTMGTVDTNQAETSPVIQYTPSPASDLDTISQRVSNINLVDRMAQDSQVLGEAGRAAAMTRYDGTTDPSGYYAGFMQAYNDGMNGKRNRQNSVLTKEQYNQAYNAGRTDSRAGLTREGAGLVRNASAVKLRDAGTIDALAKKLGVTVVAEDSISSPNGRQSGANGYMKGREIHISLKSEDPAMVVFKHEVTHYLQEQNAKGYQAFRDYAVQAMGEDEVRKVQDLYRRGGVELTWDGAMDEVAANYTEKLLTDEEAVRRLIRDDRNLAQKILDAIKGLLQKVKGQEGSKLRQAEKLWTEMFREIAGQEQADRGTMEVRYSEKGEPLYGREETEQTAKGSVRKNDTGRKDGGRENSAGTGGEGILSSVRMLSRGEKPYHSWAEEGLIVPEPGSVAESEARVVRGEYQLPVFVVKSDIFNRNHPKAPAFARGGQVFLREDLPEIGRGDIGAHEAGHAMKEIGYLPYLDFIEKTPELINRSHPLAGKILEHASKHTEVDLFNMSDQDAIDLYDEINNMVYGAIHAGRTEIIDIIRPVFFDFDAYSKELSSVHEQFKKERNKGARFSIKSTDSQGRQLTKEQQEYFRDSVIRDDKGHLMVMYHGTRNGGFTVFGGGKDYFYFTNDKRYAYIFEGRKANGQFYPSTRSDIEAGLISPQRYEVYLNVTNPFIAEQDIVEDSLYWDRSLAQKLREKGYDALMMEDMSQVIVLSPEQIKDVTNKYPTNDPDIRFSLRQENQRLDDVAARLDQIRQEGEKAGKSEAEILTEIRGEVDSTLERLRTQYGTIPEGERPTREANAPKQTTEQERVSQTVRTVLEAGVTPDAMVPTIQEAIARGDFSYESFTDKMAIDRAAEKITDENYQDTKETWLADVASGKVSKESTALGWALYNNAANSGHVEDAMKILTAMIEHQRSAAQAVQATRILKRSSPTAQLYGVKRSVENLQKELKERYGDKAPDLEINRDLAEQFLQAKTPEAQTEALRQLYMDIGRQMPSRFIDKWNAWRYLAMLGNPRTHIRNVLGNAFFAPVVGVKNLTATAIEAAVDRAVYKGTMNRSKGATGAFVIAIPWKDGAKPVFIGHSKADKALVKAAWEDFSNVYDEIQGVGKYNDAAQANRYIQDGKVVFRSKLLHFLEVLRKKNGELLELEDMWFSQPHYAAALAGYMKANGLTVQQLKNGRGIAEARAYAVLEAQKATYRDMNQFSEFVSGIGKYRGKNSAKKAASLAAEGILPFRQTPANILVRGVEYSPIGLLKSLTVDLNRVRKGEMEAYEVIDHISAGLTGTGLMGLGILLASLSLVRGAGGDDKEKREFEELMGHQTYALELTDGTSVTLDWMAPEALPFFVGVNLWEQSAAQNEKATMSTLLQAASNVTAPMLEMSCLQSLNDVFNSVGYASSEGLDALPSALASAATSYLTQGIPTLLGQIERTAQEKRMTTYTEQDAFLTGDMQYALGTSSGRIPGWDYQQIPYIDAWGRTENTGSVGQRGVNNFLNPAYTSTIQESRMERELLRLYEETGDGSLLPSRAPKYFTVNKERKDLTAEEYVAYATTRGETAYDLLWELAQELAYQSLDDESKAELVKNVYSYADAVGRTTVSDYTPTGLNADLLKLDEGGFDVSGYLLLKAAGEAAGLSQLEIAVSSTDQALSSQLILNNYEAQRTADAFTDPSRSGYEYQMNAGQQAQFTSLYEEAMEQALDKLFAGSRYQAADTEERRDMVSDLQAETNAKVKKEMARTLRAAGVRSVKKG